jgi:AraC-like DNA-binding protein
MALAVEPVVDLAAGAPGPVLRPWVDRYLGYRMAGSPPGIHTGMPSPRLTFIISLDAPVDIAAMPGAQAPGRIQAFVGGLHNRPARIAHDGSQFGVSIDLTPLGARALFGVPAGELAGQVIALDELLGRPAGALPDRLGSLATWPARFAALDGALAAAVAARAGDRRPVVPAPEVAEAFRLLTVSGGLADIGGIAREVGWSRRHLSEQFGREVGLPPKQTARLVRFDRARRLLTAALPLGRPLAAVAADAGYADQAHFTREFRQLAGRTPTAWAAEEFPSVQDTDGPHGAG